MDLGATGGGWVSHYGDGAVSIRVDISVERLSPPASRGRYLLPMVDFTDDGSPEDDESGFPLGDGTAETEALVYCPHCGEPNEVSLDPGSGGTQEYIEDCQVCCRPWLMYVKYARDGSAIVEIYAEDG